MCAPEQSGTEFDDEFEGVAIGIDGTAVLSGYTYGSWAATQAGDDEDMDFVAMSMDADGNILWEYQVGRKSVLREYILKAYMRYILPPTLWGLLLEFTSEEYDEAGRELDDKLSQY